MEGYVEGGNGHASVMWVVHKPEALIPVFGAAVVLAVGIFGLEAHVLARALSLSAHTAGWYRRTRRVIDRRTGPRRVIGRGLFVCVDTRASNVVDAVLDGRDRDVITALVGPRGRLVGDGEDVTAAFHRVPEPDRL